MTEEKIDIYDIDVQLHKIRTWVTSKGFTPHGLAKATKFGAGTFADMYSSKWNPRVSTLRELETYMLEHDEKE